MNTNKQLISMRYWLQGRGYYNALTMLNLAIEKHNDLRKDGVTPVWHHPLAVANHVRTFDTILMHPEDSLCVALGHDLLEDTDITSENLYKLGYSEEIIIGINLLTKNNWNKEYYFERIFTHPIASVVKLCDRVHNFSTMVGVFTPEKIDNYILEAEENFLPNIKISRRMFPQQEPIYENLKLNLVNTIALLKALP